MIMPTKFIPLQNTLLALGAIVLKNLGRPRSVSSLWEKMRNVPNIGNFERFTLILSLLYAMDLVILEKGLLRRIRK